MKAIKGFSNYGINDTGEVVTANGEKKVGAKNGKVQLTDDKGVRHQVSLKDIEGVNLTCYGAAGIEPEQKLKPETSKTPKAKPTAEELAAAQELKTKAKADLAAAKAAEKAANAEAKAKAKAERDAAKAALKAAGSTREKSVKMVLLETLSAHQEGLTAEAAIEKTMASYTGTSDRALMEAKWSLSGDQPKLNAQMKNANITFKDDKDGVRTFFRAAEVVAEPAKA